MFGRFLTIGLVCLLVGAAIAMLLGPMLQPAADENLPVCPYMVQGEFADLPPEVVTAVGAYEAIRETLMRDSLAGVATQADVISRAFTGNDPRIASLAKRLGAEQDVESARRAFMRLHRLMERRARQLPQP
ncbi:MAG: hypothetical protein WEC73_05400 [Chthoniobacterales bacterium]